MGFFKPNAKKMEAKHDIEGLVEALKHKSPDVRWEAAQSLGYLGRMGFVGVIEPMIQALEHEDKGVRWTAAKTFGEIGTADDARAVEPLIRRLKDSDWQVREVAAEALGEIKDARAAEPLIKALNDKRDTVRWKAAEALGKMGDSAVEPLFTALEDRGSRVRKEVRKEIVEVIGKIGNTKAIERLNHALKDEDIDVRNAAAKVLGRREKAKAPKGRIRHLLILLEAEPVEEGLEGAVSSVLNNASYKAGKPYRNFVDGSTKINIAVTGPEDYSEPFIFASARTHFPEIDTKKLRYNKFYRVDKQGRRSAGVVISD